MMKKDMKPIIVIGLVIIAVIAIAFMVLTPKEIQGMSYEEFKTICEETGGDLFVPIIDDWMEETTCGCPIEFSSRTYKTVTEAWEGCLWD